MAKKTIEYELSSDSAELLKRLAREAGTTEEAMAKKALANALRAEAAIIRGATEIVGANPDGTKSVIRRSLKNH
jgi:hypothetical protein